MKKDVLSEMPELERVVARACATASSDSRRRQIRAFARELVRALQHPEHPLDVEAGLADVLALSSLRVYDHLALEGALRARGPRKPTTEAAALVRSGVMVLLQRAAHLPPALLRPTRRLPAQRPVDPARTQRLRTSLGTAATMVGVSRTQARTVRMLAMASLVLDTGARVGELCALRLEDLSPALEEVSVIRRPQNRRPGTVPVREVYALQPATRAALSSWLLLRRGLLAPVAGDTDVLWVSVAGNHVGEVRRPAGMPLQPRGVGRAWTEAVTEVNIQLAGTPDWSPLPVRLEQMRRGISAEPVMVTDPEPDEERLPVLRQQVCEAGRNLPLDDAEGKVSAQDATRQAPTAAWREGAGHRRQQEALTEAGVAALDMPRAGWEPELLRALERMGR